MPSKACETLVYPAVSHILRVVRLPGKIITDAHYLTFWRRSAAMTAAFPWTSVGVTTGYRGNPRVFAAIATAHGTSTANAMVWATARAAVLSAANSVVLTRATHGSSQQLPRQRKLPFQFPRPSAAIATVTRQSPRNRGRTRQLPRQFPRTSNRSNFHGHPWPYAAIATVILR